MLLGSVKVSWLGRVGIVAAGLGKPVIDHAVDVVGDHESDVKMLGGGERN